MPEGTKHSGTKERMIALMNKLTKPIVLAIVSGLILVILINITQISEFVGKKIYPKKYSEYVQMYSKEYNVDELLVYAVIKVESNFDNEVVSKSDAKGLMQLMDTTAIDVAKKVSDDIEFKTEMLFDAETNIKMGVKYLSELLDRYNR